MSSWWSPIATKGSGYTYNHNSYNSYGGGTTVRKQTSWVAKAAPALAKLAAEVKKHEAPREKKPDKTSGVQQGVPQKRAAKEGLGPVRMPRPGKRIYNKTILLRVRDEVETPEESPMKALCIFPKPAEESGLRADAPEFQTAALGASSLEASSWAFDYGSWNGAEAPFWTMDDYNLGPPVSAGDSCEKSAAARSPGSTMCETKTDGAAEEDLGSSTTAFSVQNSPAVLPCPAPVPADPAAREAQARDQIEYYFSQKNLGVDWYLRSLMDDEGWVSVASIMQFPRMNRLGVAVKEAAAAVLNSLLVEVTWEEDPRVRLRDAEIRSTFPRYDAEAAVAACMSWQQPEDGGVDAGSYFGFTGEVYDQSYDQTAAAGVGYKPSKKQRRKQQKRQAQTQVAAT